MFFSTRISNFDSHFFRLGFQISTHIFFRLEFQISTHIFGTEIFFTWTRISNFNSCFLPRHLITTISFVNFYFANFDLPLCKLRYILRFSTYVLCFSRRFYHRFVFVRNGTPYVSLFWFDKHQKFLRLRKSNLISPQTQTFLKKRVQFITCRQIEI